MARQLDADAGAPESITARRMAVVDGEPVEIGSAALDRSRSRCPRRSLPPSASREGRSVMVVRHGARCWACLAWRISFAPSGAGGAETCLRALASVRS